MLQWNQDWGAVSEYWERRILNGFPAPPPFYERPEIEEGDQYLWRAFIDLGTERQMGMGLGPIPRSVAQAYAADLNIEGDRFDRFWSIISMIDNEYLKLANASDKDSGESDAEGKKPKVNAQPIARKPSDQ